MHIHSKLLDSSFLGGSPLNYAINIIQCHWNKRLKTITKHRFPTHTPPLRQDRAVYHWLALNSWSPYCYLYRLSARTVGVYQHAQMRNVVSNKLYSVVKLKLPTLEFWITSPINSLVFQNAKNHCLGSLYVFDKGPTTDTAKVQLGKPICLLGLLTGIWEMTQRQLYNQSWTSMGGSSRS